MKLSSLNKGLVAHWTMSQDSLKGSLLADKTPYENDGTIYGATFTTDRKGKANSAMSFDGVNDVIKATSSDIATFNGIDKPFCFSFWGKSPERITQYDGFINIAGKTGNYEGITLSYFENDFTQRVRYWQDGSENIVWTNNDVGNWHLYTVNVVNNTIIVYLDDTQVSQGSFIDPFIFNGDVYIGEYIWQNNYLKGSIDDVRIYNRALSQEEITTLYNSYNPSLHIDSLQKGLVGHWTMSQDSLKGSLLADKTPYENDGTIYGATFTTDRKGQANKAMSFDGVNDYIDCGTPIIPAGDFSISAWCYNKGVISDYNSICGQYKAGQKGRMWFGFQKSAFGYRIGEETRTVSVEYNEHLHCVITREGTTVKVYLNGNLVITRTAADSIYQGANTIIGSYDSTEGRFNGSIDDVRIYNRALSETEIKTLYDSYNPNIKMKTSLPKIKLYGGD